MSGNSFKLVLLGDGRVGKTSLVSRFAENKFDANEESTVKAQMYKRARLVIDGRAIDVSVWDTAGQERFHALGPLYYRGADGAVLVYDITDGDSFQRVRQWVKELKRTVGDDICMVVCGNKCDLESQKLVQEADAVKLAQRYNATHFYTSAKADLRVQDAFTDVITRAVRRRFGGGGGGAGGGLGGAGPAGGDVFGSGGGADFGDAAPKKRRGLMVADDANYNNAAANKRGGDATGAAVWQNDDEAGHDAPNEAPSAADTAPTSSLYADDYGFGGGGYRTAEDTTSAPSPPVAKSTSRPPAAATTRDKAAEYRVVLGPDGEGNAGGARPPKAAAAKSKKSGPGCCK